MERGRKVSFPWPERVQICMFEGGKQTLIYTFFCGEGDVCRGQDAPTTHPLTLPVRLEGVKGFHPTFHPGRWAA